LNQYETEKIAASLAPFGFRRVQADELADLYIINTCTVTHKADSDCRQLIKKAVRRNPLAKVVVTGCYVDADPERVKGIEGVHAIIRNEDKERIADLLPSVFPDLFEEGLSSHESVHVSDFFGHNRAWLKVSDGCNQGCTFCIVPHVRGRLKNRQAGEVLDEIKNYVEHGYQEVVLTGVNLGHYSCHTEEPPVKNLAGLCRLILERTEVTRVRLSSIEPQTIREELLRLYSDSGGRICRHFHVPLQSGSSRVLRLMHRPYDAATYQARIASVKEAMPNTIVGADVLVGFPGETEEDFQETTKVVTSGSIDYLHVFSYSERPGTKAAGSADRVPHEVVRDRNRRLTAISEELLRRALKRQVGETLEVIAEHKHDDGQPFWSVSDNYLKVQLPPSVEGGKRVIRVRVTRATDDHLEGDVMEPRPD
ncbi:MAG TPA: tRNA (N(6)-L-threonylcarbamoyladenosine(37)-C(2))-methylthiotransferase MtaB, partial [Candidatus Acidoferrum sp.]|nr:tRNA (N(6)-L-threonylcarbamoyladenosine(37)-C(2))-methylthiotransferase MtaB [Candidatus Acidoferrum sp.]